MLKVSVDYLGRTKDEFIHVEFLCTEDVGAPTAPFWVLPLSDGDVMFVNMAAVCQIRMEKGKIARPPLRD